MAVNGKIEVAPHDVSRAQLRSSRRRWQRRCHFSHKVKDVHRGSDKTSPRFLMDGAAHFSASENDYMDKFDVVIIGSGPGGYVAAIRAGQLGLKTAIVEKDKDLGGTCLNIGCIPSKALLTSSDHVMFAKKEAAKHGIMIENVSVDLAKMLQRKDKVVKTMTGGVRALMKTNKVTTFEGLGTIAAPGKVAVKSSAGETQEIETKNIIIATGSVPVRVAVCEVRRQNHRQQHRGAFVRRGAEETYRHRCGRDRSRAWLGLEPARFGSDGAGISAAHRPWFRSRSCRIFCNVPSPPRE